jgi:hypothetical protein
MARALLLAALVILALPARAADFDKGMAAAQAGDFATALAEWKPLAEGGEARAQFNMAVLYDNGYGVEVDLAEAMKWFRLAAEQGLAMAQYNLGFMYAAGRGVEPDVTEAAKWYWLAAEQGMPVAQFNLATLFLSPRSMPQDLINAYMWLEVATALGYMKAAEYRDAVAVRMNPGDITTAETMARKWLEEHE